MQPHGLFANNWSVIVQQGEEPPTSGLHYSPRDHFNWPAGHFINTKKAITFFSHKEITHSSKWSLNTTHVQWLISVQTVNKAKVDAGVLSKSNGQMTFQE